MRQRRLMAVIIIVLLTMFVFPAYAQEPTTEPIIDPACAMDMTEAYMSGWEYDHRDGSELDLVAAAQVAREVYAAFQPLKLNCEYPSGYFKERLLRSMHGDYPPEELARMLVYLEEAVGIVDYNECAFAVADPFVSRVEWGDSNALQVGRAIAEIYRTVRAVVPTGECDASFKLVTNLLTQLYDIPPDGTLVASLYQTLSAVTEGRYFSESVCAYEMANTFFEYVDWEGLTAAEITQLVGDTFKITYGISEDKGCEEEPALAITAMLLNDVYAFAPDASIILQTYNTASGLTVPVEATPTVTPAT